MAREQIIEAMARAQYVSEPHSSFWSLLDHKVMCEAALSAIGASGHVVVPREEIETLIGIVSHQTINLVRDYNHVHLIMDEGKEWPDARNYLVSNGWNLTTETYDYWLAFIQQKMILALDGIVESSRKSMIEAGKV